MPVACFVPSPFASCVSGVSCTGAFLECVSGIAPTLTKIVAQTFGASANATCLFDVAAASVAGCDAVATTQTLAHAAGLVVRGPAYAAQTSAIMFRPSADIQPWRFMSPFSWGLWASACVFAFAITPLVTALVENDSKRTVTEGVATFLPDSVHAYTGVDTLKRTGDEFTADSALLSAVVAIVAKVMVALYQCNLVAYVILSYMTTRAPISDLRFESVATTAEFSSARVDASEIRVFDTPADAVNSYASGASDAVVGGDAFLATRASCTDRIAATSGPVEFQVFAYRTERAADAFGDAFARAVSTTASIPESNACVQGAKSITLNETLGVFVSFGACMAFLSAMAVAVHATRHENFCAKRQNPESPNSLPESVHVESS